MKFRYPPDTPSHIYALIDPRDGEVRYIGRSMFPEFRLTNHMQVKGQTGKRAEWIRELKGLGLKPEMKILEDCTNGTSLEREGYWIFRYIRRGARLTNDQLNSGRLHAATIRDDQRERIRAIASKNGLGYSETVRLLLDVVLDSPPDNLLDWQKQNSQFLDNIV